jgi:hypothetical protein
MRRIGTPLALLVVFGAAACGGDRPASAGGNGSGELPAAEVAMEGWYTRADGLEFGGEELQVLREAQGFGFRTTHGGVAFQERDVRTQLPMRVEAVFLQRGARPDDQGAYGVFVGGKQVLVAGQEYIAFILRPTGQYRIERRVRGEITPVVDWTPADVIRGARAEGEVPMNLLRVEADQGTVQFFINNEMVATFPVTLVDPLGAVGIRVDEGVTLTVTSWEVG